MCAVGVGWRVPARWRWPRSAAILLGLAGLALVLGADGGVPRPTALGDWLGLASGVLWSVSSTGILARSDAGPGETAFVFALGALAGAAVLAPTLAPWPRLPGATAWAETVVWALATGRGRRGGACRWPVCCVGGGPP